jgi:hypothetical protein
MSDRHTTNAQVMQAVEDRFNGNRPLTSPAILQCRISEIRSKRYHEDVAFEKFVRETLRVKT